MFLAKRPYRQTARAAAAQSLRQRVVTVFNDLLLSRWIDEITLDEVAASAGTTRQTVIRLFGGKDGLLEAVIALIRAEAVPRTSVAADVSARAAVQALIAHYEAVGDMVVRFLAQEERHSALRPLLAQGRHEHRAWVAERFGSTQSGLSELERERQITRLIVATDIYTWKLLRRDFGKSQDEVLHLMVGIIDKETLQAANASQCGRRLSL
jgi:AcrR family transcriptional regulator